MHPAIDTIPDVDQRLSAGLTVLGFVAGTAALFAPVTEKSPTMTVGPKKLAA